MAQKHRWALNHTRTEQNTDKADHTNYGTWDIYPCQRAGCSAEHGIRRDMALDLKRYRAMPSESWSHKRPACGGA